MTKLRRKIYVTEPDMIDIAAARDYLAAEECEFIAGSTDFRTSAAPDCDTLLIRSNTCITAEIIEIFPDLKDIIRVGVGLDSVDTEFCMSHNIKSSQFSGR